MAQRSAADWNPLVASPPTAYRPVTCLRVLLVSLIVCIAGGRSPALADRPVERLAEIVPRSPDQCSDAQFGRLAQTAEAIERWSADKTWNVDVERPDAILSAVAELVTAQQRVDALLSQQLALRTQFADLPDDAHRRAVLRNYLKSTARMIDLAGRLRYSLRDAIENATYDLSSQPRQLDALVDLLIEHRVGVAASVMTYALFDPPPDSGVEPFGDAEKKKILQLLRVARQLETLPELAQFIAQDDVAGELIVEAVQAIREIGLPQDARPGYRLERAFVEPPVTARQLHERLAGVDVRGLNRDAAARRRELLDWLHLRIKQGVVGDSFRVGRWEVRAGDWVLLRNPSPYNTFTDLSPGLFTHVGVVTAEQGDDGIRRFVIVDLPERGDRIPATNVESYLQRTLHFFILRHDDEAVARKMGEVAAATIGNSTHFDLTFRTDRVVALKGNLTKDSVINTYCAGFLLLCGQETTAPREQFFPIPEHPPGGHCLQNLEKLGLSIGDRFVSPTGPVFSQHLRLVGRCAPMYNPERELKEAVYDHFGQSMVQNELTPSPTTFQALREKVADLSQFNPWLARALAKAGNVSERMDLAAAARAAAVVETLDEIANRAADDFAAARAALMAGATEELVASGARPDEIQRIQQFRQRHAALLDRWVEDELSPRELRIELVKYYSDRGKQQLDERFFGRGAE